MTRPAVRWLSAIGFTALIAAIGWLDYTTGPEFGFSLFYLLPIAACAWYFGREAGIAVAVLAAVSWFAAELGWKNLQLIIAWNAFTRLVIYAALAFLVALARSDRDRLRALNEKLAAALGAETDLARTDRLTELANSRRFLEELTAEMRSETRPVCVACIDIDYFKAVNDRYGHAAGDEFLRRSAAAIAEATRSSDVIARMGGDEFAVLFRRVSPEDAAKAASRIVERIRQVGEAWPAARAGASVGVAWFPTPPATPDEILKAADAAMYAAKAAGKGVVRVIFGTPVEAIMTGVE
ncbi:MAG TPA: diguanylate cyclase [Thermoanaerobaculia bacterium]